MNLALQNAERLIPKPPGSAGDGYCLIERMEMVNDKAAYNAIVVRMTLVPLASLQIPHFELRLCSNHTDTLCCSCQLSKHKPNRKFKVLYLFST